MRLIKNTHRLITAFCNSVIKRRILTDPTKSANMKHNVRRTLARILPTLAVMVISLIIAHFYYQPFFVPQKVLAVIYGGALAVIFMLLWPRLIPAFLATGASVILALAVIHSTPGKIITGFCALFAFALIARKQEIGIIAILILDASIMHASFIPKPVTFGGMGFSITEGLLTFMLITSAFKVGINRELYRLKSPVGFCLVVLLASVVMSLIVGYTDHMDNPGSTWIFRDAYNLVRCMYSYTMFFVIFWGIRNRRQLKTIVIAALVVTTIVSLMMPVQYFLGTGTRIFFGAAYSGPRVENLSDTMQGVTRSLPPGLNLIAMMLPIAAYMACIGSKKSRNIYAIVTLILIIGLVFSFTRSHWSPMIVSMFLIWLIAERSIKRRLASVIALTPLIALTLCVAFATLVPGNAGTKFTEALSQRFISIFQKDTLKSSSLQNRFDENHTAIKLIRKHPFFGIGAGNPIRYVLGTNYRGNMLIPTSMIHNSYLGTWVVYGLSGILSIVCLFILFIIRCFQLFKATKDPHIKAIAAGSLAGYVGFFLKSSVSMTLTNEPFSIISLTFILGIVEVAWRLNKEESTQKQLQDNGAILDKGTRRLEESIV